MKKAFNSLYVLNIIFQSVFTLLFPPALLFGLSYLAVTYLSFSPITHVIALTLGILAGLVSMIKFIITASEGLERLEKQQNETKGNKRT